MKGNVRYHLKEGRNPQVLYLFLLGSFFFPFVFAPGALLFGLIFSLFIGTTFKDIADKWSVYLLKTSVIGFVFGIDIQVLLIAGKENIGVTSAFVLGALITGILLGYLFKINRMIALLIAVGTAICGGSAIAAVGSAMKADSGQLSISTSTIFLLNVLALFARSEEHTSELQSLMRISYAVFCLYIIIFYLFFFSLSF